VGTELTGETAPQPAARHRKAAVTKGKANPLPILLNMLLSIVLLYLF
jgi:hypothetical protein